MLQPLTFKPQLGYRWKILSRKQADQLEKVDFTSPSSWSNTLMEYLNTFSDLVSIISSLDYVSSPNAFTRTTSRTLQHGGRRTVLFSTTTLILIGPSYQSALLYDCSSQGTSRYQTKQKRISFAGYGPPPTRCTSQQEYSFTT